MEAERQTTTEAPVITDRAGRPSDSGSLDNAVARLLKEPEAEKPKAKPKKEPEPEQLEEDEVGETLLEDDSEDEVEDDESEAQTKLEDEDSEEDSEEGEEGSEHVYTIKLDGEDYEVNADELKSGYQRQRDYTKKTQQLAEQRKEYEAKTEQLTVQYDQFMQNASIADQVLNRDIGKLEQIDWASMKTSDPVGYVQKQIELQDVRNQQAQLRQQAQMAWENNQKVATEDHNKMLEQERKRAIELFPDWSNSEKATAHQTKIVEYGRKLGYDESELGSISKARDLLVLDKARKYDELQNTKKGIVKSKPALKKLVKTKARPTKSSTQKKVRAEGRDRLRRSGSVRDAAALMYEMQTSKAVSKPSK